MLIWATLLILGLLLRLRVPRRFHRSARLSGPVPCPHRVQGRPQDPLTDGDQGRALLVGGLPASGLLRGRLQRQIRLGQAR